MNKLISLLPALALALTISAKAASPDPETPPTGPTVKITSFEFPNASDRTAEICGKVLNAPLPTFVRLDVDYDSDYEVPYNLPVGIDGRFCTVAVSLKSRVRGSLWSFPQIRTLHQGEVSRTR